VTNGVDPSFWNEENDEMALSDEMTLKSVVPRRKTIAKGQLLIGGVWRDSSETITCLRSFCSGGRSRTKEVTNAVAFLPSNEASSVTGELAGVGIGMGL
jgi:hypothetical protein